MRGRRKQVATGLLALGVALLLVFGLGLYTASQAPRVRGVITNVQSRDIGHASSITVRTSDGREIRFQVSDEVDQHWTPGHLRDHMLLGEPITVLYRRVGDDLIAYRILD
jgi:hypothetical protein